MEPSPFPGSSKRAKAPDNTTQVAHCLVDGCNADLSLCRDYHRRHKVCEVHSKTPMVTIGGREQRFCQQCSRFHSLSEFDEGKRSCRKRLDGHNRRRRKPQPDSLTRTSGLLFSNQQGTLGTQLLSFSNPQMLLYNNQQQQQQQQQQLQLNYIERPNSFPKVNQLQFMQGSEKTPICQPLLDPNADARSSNCSQNIYSDGLNQVVDSDCALSLLSSAPPATMEFGLVPTESFPQVQSLLQNFRYSGSGLYQFSQESKPVVSSMDYPSCNASTLHLPEVFEEGSSTSGSH